MEIKKCNRCGSFYTSDTQVCQNCMPKDKQDIIKLQGYINENGINSTKQEISMGTGISPKNLDRYLQSEEFKGSFVESDSITGSDFAGNISTNL